MTDQQLLDAFKQMQQNYLVQLKLIGYMEAEIEALKAENAALKAPEKVSEKV